MDDRSTEHRLLAKGQADTVEVLVSTENNALARVATLISDRSSSEVLDYSRTHHRHARSHTRG
jgi:hypothetical protein